MLLNESRYVHNASDRIINKIIGRSSFTFLILQSLLLVWMSLFSDENNFD